MDVAAPNEDRDHLPFAQHHALIIGIRAYEGRRRRLSAFSPYGKRSLNVRGRGALAPREQSTTMLIAAYPDDLDSSLSIPFVDLGQQRRMS